MGRATATSRPSNLTRLFLCSFHVISSLSFGRGIGGVQTMWRNGASSSVSITSEKEARCSSGAGIGARSQKWGAKGVREKEGEKSGKVMNKYVSSKWAVPPTDLMSLPYWSYGLARKKLHCTAAHKIGMHNVGSKVKRGSFCRVVIEKPISERISNSPSPFKTAESVSEGQYHSLPWRQRVLSTQSELLWDEPASRG